MSQDPAKQICESWANVWTSSCAMWAELASPTLHSDSNHSCLSQVSFFSLIVIIVFKFNTLIWQIYVHNKVPSGWVKPLETHWIKNTKGLRSGRDPQTCFDYLWLNIPKLPKHLQTLLKLACFLMLSLMCSLWGTYMWQWSCVPTLVLGDRRDLVFIVQVVAFSWCPAALLLLHAPQLNAWTSVLSLLVP